MVDIPYSTDRGRLRDNIRTELQAQRAMRNLDLDDATLDGLADGIASNVDNAFSVQWAPRWVHGDDPHRWTNRQVGSQRPGSWSA